MHPINAILIVIIRLWAAGALLKAIANFPFYSLTEEIIGGHSPRYFLSVGISQSIWMIAGVTAWMIAPWLAARLTSKERSSTVEISIDAQTLVMIGSFLIGAFYLGRYLPELVTSVIAMLIDFNRSSEVLQSTFRFHYNPSQMIQQGVIVFAAFWMTFRPSHLARLFSHLRNPGSYQRSAETPPEEEHDPA